MAKGKKKSFSRRTKRTPHAPDELGGFADGGLAILSEEEGARPLHITPSRVASALRYFLARVELHSTDGLPSRLALTSALAGEGVTFVARSLASVIAYDTESSVVVVDVNWRRPTPPKEGEVRPLGLADAVDGAVPLSDIIRRTANPRLSLIDAGEVAVARRPALAGSNALATVLEDLEGQFDHLLLDLPPVLATSEAMNLSQFADSYALVVRQGATSENQVEAA
ncbi:MAG: CpsD/CapB family tyrosine-protein kinase, partial [Ilumatobacteraceae bacterium]